MSLTLAKFAASFLPKLAAGLTVNLLGTSARSLRKRLETPERAKALERCSGAAIAAILAAAEPDDEDQANLLGDIFERFFKDEEIGPEVAKEVSVLLKRERLNQLSLAELFEEAGFDPSTLPALDLGEGFAAFESAFVLTAQQEGALQGEILLHETAKQTVIQQKILDRLGEMAAGPLLKANSIDAQNVVNGIQIIIQMGGGAGGDVDDQAASDRRRYLQGLRGFCRSLPVAALGGDENLTEEVTLDQVFIDLDSTTQVELTQEEKKEKEKEKWGKTVQALLGSHGDTGSLSLAESLQDHPKLVVLGDPGSGKSSFVKELLARLASAQLGEGESPTGIPSDLLPALIELRDLAPRLAALDLKNKSANRRRDLRAAAVRDLISEDVARFEAPGFSKALRDAFTAGECFLVLDGLDEVPPDLRKEVRDAVAAAITKYKLRHVVLTCRKLSYQEDARLDDFHDVTIADLSQAKIHSFIAAWYTAQRRLNRIRATEQEAKTGDLQAVASSDDLKDLSKNPMLLTTMALIHQKEVGLPRERVRLYHLAVEVLALRWQKHKTGRAAPSDELAAVLQDNLRLWQILTRLGYEAHKAQQQARSRDPKAPRNLLRGEALTLLERPEYLGSTDLANEFLDYADQRTGLFVGQGSHPGRPPSYRFPHQTLQEYLAGRYMASQEDRLTFFYDHAEQGDFWRVAACLGAEDLFHVRQLPDLMLGLAYGLCPGGRRSRTNQAYRAELWSGHMATIAGVQKIECHKAPGGGMPYLQRLRKRLFSTVRGPLPPQERIQAGQLLGQLGEPDDSLTSIAKLELCWVPRGEFFFSGAAKSEEEEGDFVDLSYGYWIGRFPVTQGQFGEFVAAGGYDEERYWPGAKAAGLWVNGEIAWEWAGEKQCEPRRLGEPFDFPNHPVVGITWYEMLAFCRWLTEEAREWIPEGWSFCLPSEAEWEKAARGGVELPTQEILCPLEALVEEKGGEDTLANDVPRRTYPWGQDAGPDRGNFDGLASETSRPGIFPGGRSALGCEEMAGNVWEWTRSVGSGGRSEHGRGEKMREELAASSDSLRCVRVGSYYDDNRSVGCVARNWYLPSGWGKLFGFRVVLLPFTLDSGNSEL